MTSQHQLTSVTSAIAHAGKRLEIYKDIANARGSSRESYRVSLAKFAIRDDEAIGAIMKGSTVVSEKHGLSRSQITQLKKGSAKGNVVIALKDGRSLVMITQRQLSDEEKAQIGKQLDEFKVFGTASKIKYWVAGILIAMALAMPINETINVQGTVIGASGHQVTTTTSGIVDDIKLQYGLVKAGQKLASVQNSDALMLQQSKTELESLDEQVRAQGAYPTDDVTMIRLQRQKLRLEIQRLEKELNNASISASATGLIEWAPNILGAFIEKGQSVGQINPVQQKSVQLYVNVDEWINVEVGDKASFVNGRDYKTYQAIVKSTPSQAEDHAGATKFKVTIELDRELPTGTNGTVTVKGQKTHLATWLLRKQISTAKAYLNL